MNQNPYSSPTTKSAGISVPRRRTLRVLRLCIGVGAIAAIMVYVGDAFEWPHFNRRAGYIGTEFMRSLLYAINDPYAIHIVAFLWFCYGASVAGLAVFAGRLLLRRRKSSDSAH